jgi:hypothetical protein
LLDDAASLRALLPGGVVGATGPGDVAACLCALVEDFDTVEVVGSAVEAVVDRLLINYRLRLSRAGTRWDCTQTVVCAAVDGRLTNLDLLCSGFRETHDDHHDLPAPPRAHRVG